MSAILRVIILLAIVVVTIASEPDVKRDKEDNAELDPLYNQDHDFPEKDHSKRTFGSTTYDSYGLAKHIKVKGGQKLILGYTPVDLKYVPVIKAWRNGWRFKQRPSSRPRPVMHLPGRPKPDSNGWKPILHVPPPQQSYGWTKPTVSVLKPIRPSAPDHIHHDDHYDQHHNYHHHNYDQQHHHDHHDVHHEVHHDIVHDQRPVVVPTVSVPVPVPVPTVPVQVHAHDLHDLQLQQHHYHHGHYDYIQPHPQVVYYNPLSHVARPELPVLPLGASFPVPVASQFSAGGPVVGPSVAPVPTDYYHPHYQFVPSVQPHLDVVHEVPAPHFHPTQAVPVTVHFPIPAPAPAPAQAPTTSVAVPNYYSGHVHEHAPQVHEYPVETPATPLTHQHGAHAVEYHGHLAHLIQTPYQNPHLTHNAHQYIPDNFNPHILPGSTGALSSGFLNPGYTDLQIPEHLPEHPTYNNHGSSAPAPAPTEDTYYHGHVGLLPEGIVQPQLALEPPINK